MKKPITQIEILIVCTVLVGCGKPTNAERIATNTLKLDPLIVQAAIFGHKVATAGMTEAEMLKFITNSGNALR